MRWWQDIFGHLPTTEDGMKALVTGLEIALDNVQRLVAYLDWITDQLVCFIHVARFDIADHLNP